MLPTTFEWAPASISLNHVCFSFVHTVSSVSSSLALTSQLMLLCMPFTLILRMDIWMDGMDRSVGIIALSIELDCFLGLYWFV